MACVGWLLSGLKVILQIGNSSNLEYNGICSRTCVIRCGVPQGSILGPLFFLIYINNIHNASDILDLVLFADDTNVFFSHNDLSILTNMINVEMAKLSEWFKANKLSINVSKSKCMIFKPRQKRLTVDLSIEVNNSISSIKLKKLCSWV